MTKKRERIDEEGPKPVGKNPMLVALGWRIKDLRTAAGLSQRQFGEAAGLSQSYVYLLEGGGPNISVTVLESIARALGVSIGDLFEEKAAARSAADPILAKVASELMRLGDALDARSNRDAEIVRKILLQLDELRAISRSPHETAAVDQEASDIE